MTDHKQPSPNRGVFRLQITSIEKKGDRWGLLHGLVTVLAWDKDMGEHEIRVPVKCKVFAPWTTRCVGCEGQVVDVKFDFTGREWEGKAYFNYTVSGIEGLKPVAAKPPPPPPAAPDDDLGTDENGEPLPF